MSYLTADQIDDLVKGTLKELGRNKFQQIAQEIQSYSILSKWLKKDKVVFDGGLGIQRNLMTSYERVAKHTGLADKDNVNIFNHMQQMQVDWKHAQTSWGYFHREVLMNRGKGLVFNVIKPRRVGAMLSLADELEDAGWGAVPEPGDTKYPYGIPYWITGSATEGFNGMAPGTHTTKGGINPTTTPGFRNYTAPYTAISKADCIKKMRKGHRKMGFKSPIDISDYRKGNGQRYRLYVNEETTSNLEDLGEAQNDNLGKDLASMDNMMTFKRHPIEWVPKLDEDTTDPIYMIDHSTFFVVVLKGDYLREGSPIVVPEQHDARAVFIDLTYNFICVDVRRNGKFNRAS